LAKLGLNKKKDWIRFRFFQSFNLTIREVKASHARLNELILLKRQDRLPFSILSYHIDASMRTEMPFRLSFYSQPCLFSTPARQQK